MADDHQSFAVLSVEALAASAAAASSNGVQLVMGGAVTGHALRLFHEGALDHEEQAIVEAALEADSGLAERLARVAEAAAARRRGALRRRQGQPTLRVPADPLHLMCLPRQQMGMAASEEGGGTVHGFDSAGRVKLTVNEIACAHGDCRLRIVVRTAEDAPELSDLDGSVDIEVDGRTHASYPIAVRDHHAEHTVAFAPVQVTADRLVFELFLDQPRPRS